MRQTKNSEIYKTGHWLINALSKIGQDRKESLLEKDLVHSWKQIMCWRCNQDKGDGNTFELQHACEYLDALASEALVRYPLL